MLAAAEEEPIMETAIFRGDDPPYPPRACPMKGKDIGLLSSGGTTPPTPRGHVR
jgi:hypothetical protein